MSWVGYVEYDGNELDYSVAMKLCKHENCDRKSASRGYCPVHYGQYRRRGETYDLIGLGKQSHRCNTPHCGATATDFCDAHALEGRGVCDVPSCEIARRSLRNKFCDKHAREERRLRHFYKIGVLEYIEMRESGVCQICDKPASLHLDHNHETGVVRGMLCGPCNRALGLMSDDPRVLRKAADYLEKEVVTS